MIKIIKDKDNYDISEEEASYLPIIPPVIMAVASLFVSRLNDIIGRKTTLLLIALPYTTAWIISAFAKNIWMFYIFRVASGLGDACIFSSVPMYIGEIATPKVRGFWGNTMSFSMYLGQLLVNVIGSYCNVQQTAYICITIPIIFLIVFPFMPESPYYYIMKGNYEQAKESLRRLRRKTDVEEDFQNLKKDVDRQVSESGTWKDLFTINSNRKALVAGTFLRTSQQFGGISVFIGYAQFIFEKAGGSLSPQMSSIVFFGTITILNFVAGFTLEKLGRRNSYLLSMLMCGVILLIESIYFYLDMKKEVDLESFKWVPITAMVLYVIFFSIGMGIVPTLMLGELFSASIKVKGLTFLVVLYGVLIAVASKIFYFLTHQFGLYAPFLLFCTNCFISAVVAYFLVPETKGKTLEEIQMDLKGKNRSKNVNESGDNTEVL